MKRRSFLAGLIAAPAIVKASNIMPIWVPKPIRSDALWLTLSGESFALPEVPYGLTVTEIMTWDQALRRASAQCGRFGDMMEREARRTLHPPGAPARVETRRLYDIRQCREITRIDAICMRAKDGGL